MLFLGLFLLKLGYGLFKQQRMSWFWAMAIVILSVINSFVPPVSWHIAIIGIIYLILLYAFRHRFYRLDSHNMSYQKAIAWLSVFFALAYGVAGSYFFRSGYNHINSWVDAFYYTITTYSTVGYGDIVPVTADAKVFTISMILIGVASFLTALGVLLGPIIQLNMRGVYKMMSNIHEIGQHVLLCGDNVMTRELANLYTEKGKMCFFIEPDPNKAVALEAAQFNVVRLDPENAEHLQHVNLHKAFCLVTAYDDDAKNILIVMSAASVAEKSKEHHCQIIARIEQVQNIEKAKRVGATQVISPLKMSADWIVTQPV